MWWMVMLLACQQGDVEQPMTSGAETTPQSPTTTTQPQPTTSVFVPAGASDYCEATVDVFCPYYNRCNRIVGTEDTCRDTFLEACNAVYEPFYASLEAEGLLELSLDGIEACRTHLQTVTCEEQVSDLDGPCGQIWNGLAQEGEDCGFGIGSFVCQPMTTCVLSIETFCGTCEAYVADGEGCSQGQRCSPSSHCSDTGLCQPRPKVGETCADDGPPCPVGAWCQSGTCQADNWVNVGEQCDFANTCQYGAACINGVCEAEGALGEACDPAIGCRSGFCGNAGICKELKEGGKNCNAATECVSGLCDASGKCLELPGYCFVPYP